MVSRIKKYGIKDAWDCSLEHCRKLCWTPRSRTGVHPHWGFPQQLLKRLVNTLVSAKKKGFIPSRKFMKSFMYVKTLGFRNKIFAKIVERLTMISQRYTAIDPMPNAGSHLKVAALAVKSDIVAKVPLPVYLESDSSVHSLEEDSSSYYTDSDSQENSDISTVYFPGNKGYVLPPASDDFIDWS